MISRGSFSTYNFDKSDVDRRIQQYNLASSEYKKALSRKSSSKGNVNKYSTSGSPEHISRDPRIRLKAAQWIQSSVTVSCPTRSNIKKMSDRKPYATTVHDLLEYAAKECSDTANRIISECRKENKKFFDKSFYFGDRMTMYPPGSPNDCTVTEPRNVARLSELYPSATLLGNETSGSDYYQGAIGDCFFIGAVAAMWSAFVPPDIKPIKRLFPVHDKECGVYGVVFFKNGGWEWVIVDDLIAVQEDGRTPLFASVNCNILWPFIIEKAYAKVHHCWDTIDGGWAREALADMTGGIEYSIDLAGSHKKMSFQEFASWVCDPYTVLGCAVGQHVREAGGAGRAGESGAVYGLFKGHAYSILRAIQTSDGGQFIRVRNPWGNEAEWKGAYADNAPEWKRNPTHMKELAPEFKDDGAFWMSWQDFRQYYTDIDVCRFFADNLKCVTIFGNSPRNPLTPANTFIMEVKTTKPSSQIIMSLGQEDPKTQPNHREAKSLPYAVLRLSVKKLKGAPKSFDELKSLISSTVETNKVYNRQVHEILDLDAGYYSLIPQLSDAPPDVGFYLRAFCTKDDNLVLYRMDSKETTTLSTESMLQGGSEPVVPTPPVRPAVVDVKPNPPPVQPTPVKPLPAPTPSVPAPPAPVPAPAYTPGSEKINMVAAVLFSMAGGLENAVRDAFEHVDVAGRGSLELRVAEHTFSRLLMDSDVGRMFRKKLLDIGNGSLTRSAFTEQVAQILRSVLGTQLSSLDSLFSIEGGLAVSCRNAFTRTDSWNTGRLYRLHSELALSRLLMASDIGSEFRTLISKSGAYQLTLAQMQRISDQAIRKFDTASR